MGFFHYNFNSWDFPKSNVFGCIVKLTISKYSTSWQNVRLPRNEPKTKWPYLRLHTTHALHFWYSNIYCQHLLVDQKSSAWVVCRRRYGHFNFGSFRGKRTFYHRPIYSVIIRKEVTEKEADFELKQENRTRTIEYIKKFVHEGPILENLWSIVYDLFWSTYKKHLKKLVFLKL